MGIVSKGASLIKAGGWKGAVVGGGALTAAGVSLWDNLENMQSTPSSMSAQPVGGTINDLPKAPQSFKFPLEDISAGNFWTRMIIHAWAPAKGDQSEEGSNHHLGRKLLSNIWLPMPLTLGTAYNQNFSEVEDMMVNRGKNFDTGENDGWSKFVESLKTTKSVLGASGRGLAQETVKMGSGITGINVSAKMGMASVMNQQMGLLYNGAALRGHSFSWRMTPKNRDEQAAIQKIIFALKGYSSPMVKGMLGGEMTHYSGVEEGKELTDKAMAVGALAQTGDAAGDSFRSIGRLGIPPTMNIEFWYGNKLNPHLFKVKDSFIQSVEVNYTPTGTWNAYEDGAPIETQLTLGLKENAIVTQGDIRESGGF